MDSLASLLHRDELLNKIGLEMKPTATDVIMPSLAVFGAGLLAGAVIGLLVAPRPGRELRQELSRKLQDAPEALAKVPQAAAALTERVSGAAGALAERAAEAVHTATEPARDAPRNNGKSEHRST